MNVWMVLWITVLVATLSMFTCLTIAVAIGGALDIRKMLSQVRRQHRAKQGDSQ